jgi:hypothetical protein
MKNLTMVTAAAFCFIVLCSTAKGQAIVPPSQLPANTPPAYNLIVPVVGQQQSQWCWAACGQMVDNYIDPLPVVQQCKEANAMFAPGGVEPQPCPSSGGAVGGCNTLPTTQNPQTCFVAWSDCCSNGSSCACDVGDGGSSPQFPFNGYASSTPSTPLTWDQLRYQIWVVNKPFPFGWTWYPCCGAHIQVVTGYETDAQGNQWVYVNNPEPQNQGDFECMSYDEWSQDTSSSDPFIPHTHEGDWFDFSYAGTQPQLIYNLPTNSVVPVVALTEAQAPNLAGTVISDRLVPFTTTGGPVPTNGQIQERVVQENVTKTLDFYYHVTNASGAPITQLTIQNFGRATVAVAYRPDSLGTVPALQASRDVTGNTIHIYLQIPPSESSYFILLMTNATISNDQGSMAIGATVPPPPRVWQESVQVATDQPTAIPMTTANMSTCPVFTQPLNQAMANLEPPSTNALSGLPKRLAVDANAAARKTATESLPRQLSKATVGAPIQLADVAFNQIAEFERGRAVESLVRPSTGLIVPVHISSEDYLAVFLRGSGSHYVPVGMGEPNMTRLMVQTIDAVAKQHNVPPESLTVLRVPGLFLTFVARSAEGKTLVTPVFDVPRYDFKSGQEIDAQDAFLRLQPAAKNNHPSSFPMDERRLR